MHHLLYKVKKKDVIVDPFPHVIVNNAIDDELCLKLISEFPYVPMLTKGVIAGESHLNNQRINYFAHQALNDLEVSSAFKDFIRLHLSQEFFNQILFLFKDHILRIYPTFEKDFKPFKDLKWGISGINEDNADILFSFSLSLNTPVIDKPSRVLGKDVIHLDYSDKLFAGLFYMRIPGDDSTGGGLEFYRFLKNKKPQFYGYTANKDYIENFKTINYKKNVLVLFLNTINSLHSVSERSVTRYPRYFIYFTGILNKKLFSLERHQSFLGLLRYYILPNLVNKVGIKK